MHWPKWRGEENGGNDAFGAKVEEEVSERMTREKLLSEIYGLAPGAISEGMAIDLAIMIEADREAIREEARAELLKDHFKIGEVVLADFDNAHNNWRCLVSLFPRPVGIDPINLRRPAKKQPMTEEQAIAKIVSVLADPDGPDALAILKDWGISTEVDE